MAKSYDDWRKDINAEVSSNADYQAAKAKIAQADANRPTYAGTYDQDVASAYNNLLNREKFNYNLSDDALYKQYADKYMAAGKLSMKDTMGQAAALTGGYGSSYGQAVGQQAYDKYLQGLSDVALEMYDRAYGRYQDEGQRLKDAYGLAQDMANTEYGRYQDTLGQWNTDYNRALDEANNAYNRAYNMGNEAYNRAYNEEEQAYNRAWNEDERNYNRTWNEDERAYSRDQDAYNRAWNEDQRAYERAWNEENRDYSRAQDAYNRAWNEDQRAYERAWNEENRDYTRTWNEEERAYNRQLDNAQTLAAYGDFSGFAQMFGKDRAAAMQKVWNAGNFDLAYNSGKISAEEYRAMTGQYPAGYQAAGAGGSGNYYDSYYYNTVLGKGKNDGSNDPEYQEYLAEMQKQEQQQKQRTYGGALGRHVQF